MCDFCPPYNPGSGRMNEAALGAGWLTVHRLRRMTSLWGEVKMTKQNRKGPERQEEMHVVCWSSEERGRGRA